LSRSQSGIVDQNIDMTKIRPEPGRYAFTLALLETSTAMDVTFRLWQRLFPAQW